MITIKNRTWQSVLPKDVCVHRPSPLGNPYSHKHGTLASIVVESREKAIEMYKAWLDEKIRVKDNLVCNELNRIYKLALKENFALVCFCTPQKCHAEVVQEVIMRKVYLKTPELFYSIKEFEK